MADGGAANSDRLSTGIEGLDTILFGGIPLGNQVVVSGGPGAGKTLLCMEIVYQNAKRGIPCAYMALEEQESVVLANFKRAFPAFSDIDELISSNTIVLAGQEVAAKIQVGGDSESYSFGNVLSAMESIIRSNSAKCVVVDSLSLIKLMFGKPSIYRRYMLALSSNLRRLGVTSLLTVELPRTNRNDMVFSPEFFIFDGTVVMYQSIEEDKRTFTVEVVKMRGSNHSLSFAPYEITNRGFKVFSISEV